MLKRQVVVSSIRDITNQLKDLADGGILEEAVLRVDNLNQQWNDLSQTLTSRQALLEVNKQLFLELFN